MKKNLLFMLIIPFLLTSCFGEEIIRPEPLSLDVKKFKTYDGTYEKINISELGIDFNFVSGGEILKSKKRIIFKNTEKNINSILTFKEMSDITLKYNDSLISFNEKENIEYSLMENIIITKNPLLINKKRNDFIRLNQNTLIRMTKPLTFINGNKGVVSFEKLSGKKELILEIYNNELKKALSKEEKIKLSDSEKEKGLVILDKKVFNNDLLKNKLGVDDFIITVEGKYKKNNNTKILNGLLDKVSEEYLEKYGFEISEEELLEYKKMVGKRYNIVFEKALVSFYIIKGDYIYNFDTNVRKKLIELGKIKDFDFIDDFYVSNINITTPTFNVKDIDSTQHNFLSLHYLLPTDYLTLKDKDVEKIYQHYLYDKKGRISIKLKEFDYGEENKVILNKINNLNSGYIETVSDKIYNVKLLKSDKVTISDFKGYVFLYEVILVNGEKTKYIEYFLFDGNKYYDIVFNFNPNDFSKNLFTYFQYVIKNIKKSY